MNKDTFKLEFLSRPRKYAFVLSVLFLHSCVGTSQKKTQQIIDERIAVGAERMDLYLPQLHGKRVAVVGNQSSLVGDVHLVDTLLAVGVNVTKVFAPEHGFRGQACAGEKFSNEVDEKTGVPIVAIYGKKNRKPPADKLEDVDVILFDLQDVGVRFYTYISSLHYIMQACAENDIRLIILDRPNPNGHYVDGPILKEENKSFIGMHPVPIVHGMTIGEYGSMLQGEHWFSETEDSCLLAIIPCLNYIHNDFYELPVRPSPNLPNMSAVYLYPSLCFFEGTNVSVGRGTETPFQMFGAPTLPKSDFSFVPVPNAGAKHPKNEGDSCFGVDLQEYGFKKMRYEARLNFDWLISAYQQTSDKSKFFNSNGFINLLMGDKKIVEMIKNGTSTDAIRRYYAHELEVFLGIREKYLLYPDFKR